MYGDEVMGEGEADALSYPGGGGGGGESKGQRRGVEKGREEGKSRDTMYRYVT